MTPEDDKLVTAIETMIKKAIARTDTPDLPPAQDPAPRRGARNGGTGRTGRSGGRDKRHRNAPSGPVYESPRREPHPDPQSRPHSGQAKPTRTVTAQGVSHDAATAFGDELPAFLRRPRTVAKRSS